MVYAGQFLAAASALFQLPVASPVAVLLDQVAGYGELGLVAEEAGAVEVDVGEVERHRAALGNLLGLVEGCSGRGGIAADEVIQRGGEEAFGKVVRVPALRRPLTAVATCGKPSAAAAGRGTASPESARPEPA